MIKHFHHFLVMFLCVAMLGSDCVAFMKIGGVGGFGYTILAGVLLWPLVEIGKAMIQELKQEP